MNIPEMERRKRIIITGSISAKDSWFKTFGFKPSNPLNKIGSPYKKCGSDVTTGASKYLGERKRKNLNHAQWHPPFWKEENFNYQKHMGRR